MDTSIIITILFGLAGIIITLIVTTKKSKTKVINKNVLNFRDSHDNNVKDNNLGVNNKQ